MINWSREFEEFLIQNDIFSQFISNMMNSWNMTFDEYIDLISPVNYIYCAFARSDDKINWVDYHKKWKTKVFYKCCIK